jgi:hypothetical protein
MGGQKDSKFTKPVYTAEEETRLRQLVSEGFQETTEEMMARGVKYRLGAKDGETEIDCSGFVRMAAMRSIEDLANVDALRRGGRHQEDFFDTGAGDQIGEVARHSRFVINGKDKLKLSDIREGMLIAMDRGDLNKEGQKEWDHGLDHIVLVYKDRNTGKLMVGQSSSSGGGVNAQPLEDWYKKIKNSESVIDLQAVDVVKMLQAKDARPDETKIAARAADRALEVITASLEQVLDTGALGIQSKKPVAAAKSEKPKR